jgi:cytochrome oxidase Cu insertion factor (SCO1/SenC/PrrC family)
MSRSEVSEADPMIQMSVHSLPQAGPQVSTQRTRMGRLKMLAVWAVCAAPVIASYLTYYVIKPQGRSNYGTLIMPPKPLPSEARTPGEAWTDLQGQPVQPASLKGQWLLVTVAGGACDEACEKHLYLQRQLRETLGRDKDRMDRVWLVNDQAPVRENLMPGLKDAAILRVAPEALKQWLAPETGQALEAHFYLVDPKGEWMMRFPANAEPSRVKKDLAKLLKASESWDEAGR